MSEMEKEQKLETTAQTERIGLGDLVIAGIIAVGTWLLLTIWEFPGLYPGAWNDVAVATGVRPAANVVPGYLVGVASVIYGIFGTEFGTITMRILGHALLSVVAVGVYAVLREWLAFAMRARPQLSRRRTLVMRLASALGAAAFVFSDPVWNAGQFLSETTLLIALTIGAIEFYFVFLRKGDIKYTYFCAILLGLLTAETPVGLFLIVLFIWLYFFILNVMPMMESPLFKPTVVEVGKWYMTFIFLAAVVAGVVINCGIYILHDGPSAIGQTGGYIPLKYLLDYWARISGAASPLAWLIWVGVCILPFVVSLLHFPASADEERFLDYSSGMIFFVCGVAVFSQSAFLPALWFWTYFPVNSQFMLSLGMFCTAATLASAITILGVDSLCRNHASLAGRLFGSESEEDGDEDEEGVTRPMLSTRQRVEKVEITGSMTLIRRVMIVAIPLVALLIMVVGRPKTAMREMQAIVRDAIAQIVDESGDARYLFSDGNLDAAIEIESAARGGKLKCYSLLGGDGAMAYYLRTRDLEDEEDRFSFRYDTAMGLRSWIRDKPERLAESAVLMGFDLWKRDGKPLPPMGGLVSRPTGFANEQERQIFVGRARALAERMLALNRRGGTKDCTDPVVKRMFLSAQWRVARMCFYRAEANDLKGLAEEAIAEVALSKELNDCNDIYNGLVAAMEKRNSSMMQKLTPREGLQLALVRADFTMGKIYAETILGADPDNPDANFAMGMYYLKEHQLSRAEAYLRRCLIRKPDEPAVYNNLAMIEIELGKLDAAKSNVEKALAILPESAAILETKKLLEETQKQANATEKK